MDLSNVDNTLFAASSAGQIVLLLVLFKRKLYKEFPIFTAYVALSVTVDLLLASLMHFLHMASGQVLYSRVYFQAYSALQLPQDILGFAVLVELARNVMLPVKRSLPSGWLAILGVLLVIGAAATYVLVAHSSSGTLLSRLGGIYLTISLTNAVLRIVCFIVIAGFAQMLGIGWKNHVVQLATGLAFYGAVDLLVRIAHAKLSSGANLTAYYTQFRLLDELRVIGYLSTLTFWCWSFARKEAPRKEFSPQMAGFLVSMAGAVKKDRSQFGR